MRAAIGLTFFLTALAVPASPHHSVSATFDTAASVSVTGVVMRVEWRNPHVVIHINIEAGRGNNERHIEIAAPVGVERRGLRQTDIRVGDAIAFQGWAPKPGAGWIGWLSGTAVTLADGRRFDVSDNFGGRPVGDPARSDEVVRPNR